MNAQKLIDTAKMMVAGDKGLLAIDESNPTCNKRFAKWGFPRPWRPGRAYRELIVTTPNLGECISGVILYDETNPPAEERWHALRQSHHQCGNYSRHQG